MTAKETTSITNPPCDNRRAPGFPADFKRESGILLPVSALPGPYGIGCFSRYARQWIDALAAAGQSYWQILPLGPTGYGDSPYQSFSTFAGNPYFIDLEALCKSGALTPEECDAAQMETAPDKIDYGRLYASRLSLLRRAFDREKNAIWGVDGAGDGNGEGVRRAEKNSAANGADSDYRAFEEDAAPWLEDYALFMALKSKYHGAPWSAWEDGLRLRKPDALQQAEQALSEEIRFQKYLQYRFFRQWEALFRYAHEKGIRIIGDVPIYVALDSADVWASPELFRLDENRMPTAVAGCPPDGFAADGQLWGNPLYRWEYHRETGYRWWMERLRRCFRLCDVLRIDHFRGFDAFYAIPYGSKTAATGHWEPGPGLDLFQTMEQVLGKREVIAEDLGYVTDSVRQLVRDTGFPGMKVLQFAFDSRDTGSASDYLPHNYPRNAVVYTGTHDNETAAGWLSGIPDRELRAVRAYLCDNYTPDAELFRPFTAAAMRSVARLCVIPMQDWLGLGNGARLNQPSTVGANWRWRVTEDQLTDSLWREIAEQTTRYGRFAK